VLEQVVRDAAHAVKTDPGRPTLARLARA